MGNNNECLGIQDTSTGLWLISINSDGTYSWGNSWDAICFGSEGARQAVLDGLGGDNFAPGRPPAAKLLMGLQRTA